MALRVTIRCDAEGCDAEAEVNGPSYEMPITPICASPTGMFVLDTGWLNLPEGWAFVDSEDRCPAHR